VSLCSLRESAMTVSIVHRLKTLGKDPEPFAWAAQTTPAFPKHEATPVARNANMACESRRSLEHDDESAGEATRGGRAVL
jgi:hypothetical protein